MSGKNIVAAAEGVDPGKLEEAQRILEAHQAQAIGGLEQVPVLTLPIETPDPKTGDSRYVVVGTYPGTSELVIFRERKPAVVKFDNEKEPRVIPQTDMMIAGQTFVVQRDIAALATEFFGDEMPEDQAAAPQS